MYAMVDKLENEVPNINQFYMAALMSMLMLVIELMVMGSMYANKKMNLILVGTGIVGKAVFFLCIHQQTWVKDQQFLNSMIPHHAAAVLMVEKAALTDPGIKKLADNIITSQQAEIKQMKDKLKELEK